MHLDTISRLLIANRGEIAIRAIKICKELGIESVLAVSEADMESMPAKIADQVVCIGPPQARYSYLLIDTIVAATLGTNSDAIYPGYGFLAENPDLARVCEKCGVIFVGPTEDNMRKMGDKIAARKIAKSLQIPIIPGSEISSDYSEAVTIAEEIGFPLLIKAAAGGGGRGIKIVEKPEGFKEAIDIASAEAQSAFGDGRLYIERYISNARHIEVQIFGDHFGQIIHFGERDCSLQRRNQKMVEEAPSGTISNQIRENICNASLAIASYISYKNAGTVEFVFDMDSEQYYFIEMNTRIQVEHPVTEMITGIDLVKEQILAAANYPLSISQSNVNFSGHAIECRITAENPNADFSPCPGKIIKWIPPEEKGIRVDSHCYSGYVVPPYYDSLLAKLIVVANDRLEAIKLMKCALSEFVISGIDTTIPFFKKLLNRREYIEGKVHTTWIEKHLNEFA